MSEKTLPWLSFPGIIALLILLTTSHAEKLQESGRQTYNIRNYGAVGDGVSLDHEAINRAIEAASREPGGGTILVPAGNYLCGSIRLKSNIDLHLDAGAVIIAAPQSSNAYDETEEFVPPAYQDGGHTYFRNSLIWGEKLDNVSITGPGMIDGRGSWDKGDGLYAWNPVLDRMAGCASEGPRPELKLGADGKPLPNNGLPPVRRGNKAIALKLCTNVLIRDVTIYRAGHFAVLATGCDNITIDNVTIDTNRDGIDIDCCRNVNITNCRVNAPLDDAISPKSSFALGEARFTENMLISNCVVTGYEVGSLIDGTMIPGKENQVGRIKFGTESSGGFRNVTITNCKFQCSMGLALQSVDGGILENFKISNLSMSDVRKYGMHISTGTRNRTPDLKTKSRMRNVEISDVQMDGVGKIAGIIVTGIPEQPIAGVTFRRIKCVTVGGGTKKDAAKEIPEAAGYPKAVWAGDLSAYGIFARHVRDLKLEEVSFGFAKPEMRPAAVFINVDGLTMEDFDAEVGDGVPAAVFAPDVKNLTVTRSPVIKL
jgi:polygalacturonase